MRLKIIRMDLPLKHVMTVFRGTISVIRAVVVELEQDGLRGYGEAYEDQHWGVSIESMIRVLESCRELTVDYALADPYAFSRRIDRLCWTIQIPRQCPQLRWPRAICGASCGTLPCGAFGVTIQGIYQYQVTHWGSIRFIVFWRNLASNPIGPYIESSWVREKI